MPGCWRRWASGWTLRLPRPVPVRVRREDFLQRRRQLVEMRKAEKGRRFDAGQPDLKRHVDKMIRCLDREISQLEQQIAAIIAQDP